jgi:ubiquinone/menaquinone biosynthesis C-methylase UbiE
MEETKIKAYYQEKALKWSTLPDLYGNDPLSALYHLREISFVRKSVEARNNLVLDIACGPGRWILEYAANGAEVIALDISVNMIKSAKMKTGEILKKPTRVHYVVGDAEHLPFADNKLDVANCFDAFPHFPHPLKTLCEMRRVLRPGGSLLFEPSNIFSPMGIGLHILRFLTKAMGIKKVDPIFTEWNRYDNVRTVKEWIKLAGLKLDQLISVGYFIPPSHGFISIFQKLETSLDNVFFLNTLGSRIAFKCRK